MAKGGARNRSGPQPDPSSNRSDVRGVSFSELPNEGYSGEAPAFPLDNPSSRELDVWAGLWTTPKAAAWAAEPWRWSTVGMYARVLVRAEAPDSGPGVLSALHRFADQVGMTPAGLKENGWSIRQPDINHVAGESAPAETRGRRLRAAQ